MLQQSQENYDRLLLYLLEKDEMQGDIKFKALDSREKLFADYLSKFKKFVIAKSVPDEKNLTSIACDASNVTLCGIMVLFHRDKEGNDSHIANVSKTLNDSQRRYIQI